MPRSVPLFMALALALLTLLALIQFNAHAMAILLNVLLVFLLAPLLVVSLFASLYASLRNDWLRRWRLPLAAISAAVFFVVAYHGLVGLLDRGLQDRSYAGIYDDCRKVWATRGLVVGAPVDDSTAGNDPASVRRAFAHGARGAEIDIFYDAATGRYVVSHNFPYDPKNGELLSLEKLLRAVDGEHYYWLDFKRLRHLDDEAVVAATARLAAIADALGLEKGRIYVEGATPFHLAHFRDAGFMTIFDIQPLADDHLMTPVVINLYKAIFHFGDFSVMGMDYAKDGAPIYGPVTRELLGGIPVFVYHIPDQVPLLEELSALPQVRVLLDHDHGADRYGITACEDKSNGQD